MSREAVLFSRAERKRRAPMGVLVNNAPIARLDLTRQLYVSVRRTDGALMLRAMTRIWVSNCLPSVAVRPSDPDR